MPRGRSVQGPSDEESREEKLARTCDRAAFVMDGLTVVSPFLTDKGPVIAMITRLLAWGLRFVADEARGR
ncbi:hypothetical protein ADL03_27165 [Nocardia sp. NRRL S-836]|nr:hypothetical protein ADL03_27165 [Nocardia sp. NRRL S-836]